MKKRNLILSLICSIALTIGLVTFTIISLIPKGGDNSVDIGNVSDVTTDLNEGRDGSVEYPYIISNVDMLNDLLVGKYLDENGDYIDYTQTDEEGNLVYPELNAGLNFELASNIDFAGADFDVLFNKGMAFNGTIDGKGFALENITINVTKENLADFMYLGSKGFRAHIGLFGKLDGAKITNLAVNNITLNIDSEVLAYLRDAETTFVTDHKSVMYEMTVGLLAGLAFESEIDVDVTGAINGFAYCYREDDKASGTNAIGGLIGSTVDSDITGSTAKVEMALDGTNYFVGGLVGKAYNTIANSVKADLVVSAKYNQKLYIGGAAGYAAGIEINEARLALNVIKSGERLASDILDLLSSEKVDETINIAGIVAFIRANDETQKATIKNVFANSDVSIDGVFAGAFIEVWSTANKSTKTVFIENISVVSNVDTLKAFGLAKNITNTQILSKLATDNAGYDFAITGSVRFSDDAFEVIASYIDDIPTTLGEDGYETLTIILGKSLKAELDMTDLFMVKMLEKANRLEVIEGRVEIEEEVNDETNTESGDNVNTEVESGENVADESGDNAEVAA